MDAVANEVSGDTESDLKVGVKLNDDNQKNVELYSGQLSNGEALPEWIRVNPETGETTADMPEGVEAVEVQLVALDKDGYTRDINIELDVDIDQEGFFVVEYEFTCQHIGNQA